MNNASQIAYGQQMTTAVADARNFHMQLETTARLSSEALDEMLSCLPYNDGVFGDFGGPQMDVRSAMELDAAAMDAIGPEEQSESQQKKTAAPHFFRSKETKHGGQSHERRPATTRPHNSKGETAQRKAGKLNARPSEPDFDQMMMDECSGDGGLPGGTGPKARRLERNAREQRRSVKIVSQIEELSNMLEEAGASSAKSCKASVLGAVSDYIETLQKRNATLEAEKCEIA